MLAGMAQRLRERAEEIGPVVRHVAGRPDIAPGEAMQRLALHHLHTFVPNRVGLLVGPLLAVAPEARRADAVLAGEGVRKRRLARIADRRRDLSDAVAGPAQPGRGGLEPDAAEIFA